MKKYKAKREGLIHYIIVAFSLLPIFIIIFNQYIFEKPFMFLPLASPLFLILWIYFDTSYKITDRAFFYRSGFLRGKIEIEKIKEIVKGKTLFTGIKPALAKNGLIIKYNRYDQIYIAPENDEEIIGDLLAINPQIKITNHK